jgi:hypothetical protein
MNLQAVAKRKAEIQEILRGFNRETVRKDIIEVIQELRKVSRKEACDVKMLYPNEVKEIYSRYKIEVEIRHIV